MDAGIATQVMTTTTNQLVFEMSSLIITAVFGTVGYYVKKFLATNEFVKKYNLDNEKTERLLANALAYAEAKAKEKTESEINKRQFAVSYLEKISPETIAKHGDKLELMLDRKFEQLNQQFVSTPVPVAVTDARIQG